MAKVMRQLMVVPENYDEIIKRTGSLSKSGLDNLYWADQHEGTVRIFVFLDDDVDYRDLLKKYINHVSDFDGSTFLGVDHREGLCVAEPRFNDNEWDTLTRLAVEN